MAKGTTWQDAEDLLIAAIEYLGALPDRERRFLAPGRGEGMSSWPDIVRSVREGDYGDGQGVTGASLQSARRPPHRAHLFGTVRARKCWVHEPLS